MIHSEIPKVISRHQFFFKYKRVVAGIEEIIRRALKPCAYRVSHLQLRREPREGDYKKVKYSDEVGRYETAHNVRMCVYSARVYIFPDECV